MRKMGFITAIGTPLTEEDELHVEGLEAHLDDQEKGGISALLVAGSMGAMQMLKDQVWIDLAKRSVNLASGRFETLVGAGDTSYSRTRDRISVLNEITGIDGVVVLTPYFFKLNQRELLNYFSSLADHSFKPIYLYDLPGLTGVALEIDTVCKLAAHPNIKGIKCSGEFPTTKKLIDAIDENFRIIVAQPAIMDVILRSIKIEQLDGMFSVFPAWVSAMGKAASENNWQKVSNLQKKMNAVTEAMLAAGVFGGFTAIMNAKGIPGRFGPRPMALLEEEERLALIETDPVKSFLSS